MFVQLRKRLSNYFSLQSEFSWFKVFTDNTFGGDPLNPRDLAAEKGVASFRPPKELSVNYIFDVPVGPGRAFPLTWTGKLRVLLEGWRISGITRIRDGRPFHPTLFGDYNNDGLTADRPDRLGSGRLPKSEQTIDRWFAVEDFAEPAPYAFGNSGRSILYGPGEVIWDISLIRGIKLSDSGKRLEFRFQMFNAFNNVNFDQPFAIYGSSLFGKVFGAGESREIEIALKYSF
jgi:hypothetical protein